MKKQCGINRTSTRRSNAQHQNSPDGRPGWQYRHCQPGVNQRHQDFTVRFVGLARFFHRLRPPRDLQRIVLPADFAGSRGPACGISWLCDSDGRLSLPSGKYLHSKRVLHYTSHTVHNLHHMDHGLHRFQHTEHHLHHISTHGACPPRPANILSCYEPVLFQRFLATGSHFAETYG